MRIKTSVTLPEDLLGRIAKAEPNRSAFLERIARAYFERMDRRSIAERDRRIIDANADRLNKEALDVLDYQDLQ